MDFNRGWKEFYDSMAGRFVEMGLTLNEQFEYSPIDPRSTKLPLPQDLEPHRSRHVNALNGFLSRAGSIEWKKLNPTDTSSWLQEIVKIVVCVFRFSYPSLLTICCPEYSSLFVRGTSVLQVYGSPLAGTFLDRVESIPRSHDHERSSSSR